MSRKKMKTPENISYNEVCAFLLGKADLAKVAELEKNTPLYGILGFLKQSYIMHSASPTETILTFKKADEYLEMYLAGNLTKGAANELSEAILNSERNFRVLNHLIEQHATALASYTEQSEYGEAVSDNEIVQQLRKFKDKNPKHSNMTYVKKLAFGLISVAALFFIMIMLPVQINNDLRDLYSFDRNVPLDYNDSTLRGTLPADEISDPEYNQFKHQFEMGILEYVAREYAKALSEWKGLEDNLANFEDNPFFTEEDRREFILYNAVCRIALYLSENENLDETERKILISRAIELFKKLPVDSDAEKYYYALALGLTEKNFEALAVLRSISSSSEYYRKKIILEEQLR